MSVKKKIAIISPYGAEPRLDGFAEFIVAKGLQQQGYQVRFYTYKDRTRPNYDDDLVYQGILVYRCRQRLGISPKLFWELITFRPDTIMFFHPRSFMNFTAHISARLVGSKTIAEIVGILHDPYIVDDRDNPVSTLKKDVHLIVNVLDLVKSIFQNGFIWSWKNYIFHMPTARADVIIAINEDERAYIRRFYKRESEMIYWCMPPKQQHEELKPTLADGTNESALNNFCLLIAQVKKRKGWDTSVEAIAELKKRGVIKNLVFLCPNIAIQEAQEYVNKLGISDQVIFLTSVPNEEKNWLLNHCSIVLAPSRYEGFGLPVFESFQAHKPLCATDIPVYLEFLKHEYNAMISPVGDSVRLADNIASIAGDDALRSTLIRGGDETLQKFSDTVMLGHYLRLIESIS